LKMNNGIKAEYIDDINNPELEMFTTLLENQLKHYFEPDAGLFMAESPEVIERALGAGYRPYCVLTDEGNSIEVMELFTESLPEHFYIARGDSLKAIKGFDMTRGALCAFYRKELCSVSKLLEGKNRIAVLEDVQNPTNVGAIFRSAAAMGMDGVILSSNSSDPLYRRSVRVSMGNVFLIPWTITAESESLVEELGKAGYTTLAMALRDDTLRIDDPKLKQAEKIAVFLGTEYDGLKDDTIKNCDYSVKIPMAEGVDSLNVAAASAVAFWELGNNRL